MSFIDRINKKDDQILLENYNGEDIQVDKNKNLEQIDKNSEVIRVCVLDVETTGFDVGENEIIELAMKVIELNKNDGSNIKAVAKYESYNDPEMEISEEITNLTGINNDTVKDKKINWEEVSDMLKTCQLNVAHNARFDRKFMDKYIEINNVWACSVGDIDWKSRGFFKQNLEILCIWHGFYYEAHRAMNDVNATIHLLKHPYYNENKPIVELIQNAKKPIFKIINKFPYNEQLVKLIKKRNRSYFYNPNDKSWNIILNSDELVEEETKWLTEHIYNNNFKGMVQMLSVFDKYKENI